MGVVGHHANMAGQEYEIASSKRAAFRQSLAERCCLLVGIAWCRDAREGERELHEAGAVDPVAGPAAPAIRRTGQSGGDLDIISRDFAERSDMAQMDEPIGDREEAAILPSHGEAGAH